MYHLKIVSVTHTHIKFIIYYTDLLPVQLLGVEMTEPGIQWLTENVLNQHVWFKLVRAEEDTVFCSVHKTKVSEIKFIINYIISHFL